MMENPIEMDDLGVPLFLETPKSKPQILQICRPPKRSSSGASSPMPRTGKLRGETGAVGKFPPYVNSKDMTYRRHVVKHKPEILKETGSPKRRKPVFVGCFSLVSPCFFAQIDILSSKKGKTSVP